MPAEATSSAELPATEMPPLAQHAALQAHAAPTTKLLRVLASFAAVNLGETPTKRAAGMTSNIDVAVQPTIQDSLAQPRLARVAPPQVMVVEPHPSARPFTAATTTDSKPVSARHAQQRVAHFVERQPKRQKLLRRRGEPIWHSRAAWMACAVGLCLIFTGISWRMRSNGSNVNPPAATPPDQSQFNAVQKPSSGLQARDRERISTATSVTAGFTPQQTVSDNSILTSVPESHALFPQGSWSQMPRLPRTTSEKSPGQQTPPQAGGNPTGKQATPLAPIREPLIEASRDNAARTASRDNDALPQLPSQHPARGATSQFTNQPANGSALHQPAESRLTQQTEISTGVLFPQSSPPVFGGSPTTATATAGEPRLDGTINQLPLRR